MSYMRTIKVDLYPSDSLYEYADNVTRLANNLSNAVRFRQRQVITAVSKPEAELTQNEKDVLGEIRKAISESSKDYAFPSEGHTHLSYNLMYQIMVSHHNPDYYADGISKQTAQQTLRESVRDMESFYTSCREYKEHPENYTGKPKLPGYKKKGGRCTAIMTNQDCTVALKNGKWYVSLPYMKKKPVCIGCPIKEAILKQVCIVPGNGRIELHFKFEVNKNLPAISDTPHRICAIDFGVENIMAVTNNCGLPCLLYKGGTIKSVNQLYNKKIADIVSKQTKESGEKFKPTDEYYSVTNKRNDQVSDFLHKTGKHFIKWCVENRIDTIVLGVNKTWKQDVDLGHKNNQEFVQIPFSELRKIIKYLCEWNGIRYVEREESYTSKASFLDNDDIPVYQEGQDNNYHFSGKRRPTEWHGIKKKDGFRGLYVSGNGTVINSDLNGSANILRKEYERAFCDGTMPDFQNVVVIRHPDIESRRENWLKQKNAIIGISRSKEKRVRRKSFIKNNLM